MALSVTEANAVNVVLDYAAGLPNAVGEPLQRDDLHLAVHTLVTASHRKLLAGLREDQVDDVVDRIVRRATPTAADRPAPEWDDDEADTGDRSDVASHTAATLTPIDGILPVELITKVKGASQHIGREVRLGDTIRFVGQAEVDDVSLKRTKAGPKRHQVLLITDLFELAEAPGRRLLNTMREQYRTGGADTLPFKATADAQLLEQIGLASGPDSVVVIFADETRAVWPDDWVDPPARPHPGERLVLPGGVSTDEPQIVAGILDLAGNTLEVLDDEDAIDDTDTSDPWDEEG